MLNIIKAQDQLKDLSDQQLGGVMQTGTVPGYLVLAEQQRRKRMRSEAANQGAQAPTTTVAEDIAQPSPMSQGVASLPVQAPSFASGGIVSFAGGGKIKEDMDLSDEEVLAMSQADRDAWISRMDAAIEAAKTRNSINQAPPDSHVLETPSPPSAGIVELPQAQEYVRPPAEVAADFQDKGADPSVVVPMKATGDRVAEPEDAEIAQINAETARIKAGADYQEGIGALPQAPQDMSRRPEDYMSPEELANHQRVQEYLYGAEGYKAPPAPAQAAPSYVPQPEGKARAPIVIEDAPGISALPQEVEVDRESFKVRAPIKGSPGLPGPMFVPPEDTYAELQRSELYPQISVGTPQPQVQSQPQPNGIKAIKSSPPVEDEMTKGIASLDKHLHVDEPVYKNDEAKRVSSELKDRTQKLEDNNLSMALMQVSASMLSSKSTNFGRMLGEGLSGGLQAYATGQKNIRDLQKDIGKLDTDIETALNTRNMTAYTNAVAKKSALVTAYTETKKTADKLASDQGIATLQTDTQKEGYKARSADSKEDNKTRLEVEGIRAAAHKEGTTAIKEQNLEHKKDVLEQKKRADYNHLIEKRAEISGKINDKASVATAEEKAEWREDLENMDRIIAPLEAELFPNLPARRKKSTYDPSKVTLMGSKKQDGPTVEAAAKIAETPGAKPAAPNNNSQEAVAAIDKKLSQLSTMQTQYARAYKTATGNDKTDIVRDSTALDKQIADLKAQKSKLQSMK